MLLYCCSSPLWELKEKKRIVDGNYDLISTAHLKKMLGNVGCPRYSSCSSARRCLYDARSMMNRYMLGTPRTCHRFSLDDVDVSGQIYPLICMI